MEDTAGSSGLCRSQPECVARRVDFDDFILCLYYVTIYEVSMLAAADDDLRLRPRSNPTVDG